MAVDDAIGDFSLKERKRVAQEWWDWNSRIGSRSDPRRPINEGLGVNVHFETPLAARQFMNLIYDKVIVSIRAEDKGWKP